MLEAQIHMLLDKLSNDEFDGISNPEQFIDEALKGLKETWMRQLTTSDKNKFRLRMSNIGRPLCQLQMAASGAKPKRKKYNFKIQMMIGDAVEAIADVILKMAGANITGSKTQVKMNVGDVEILGEDDIHIDDKVYDIKSCSPWAFDNKWSYGYEGLKQSDDFGYVGQLTGYAHAQNKDVGGWIVINKSDGRVAVVDADVPQDEKDINLFTVQYNVKAVTEKHEFKRQFEPVPDVWRGKPSGRRRLCKSCEFCDFVATCWPDAEYKAHPDSAAKSPPYYWYIKD